VAFHPVGKERIASGIAGYISWNPRPYAVVPVVAAQVDGPSHIRTRRRRPRGPERRTILGDDCSAHDQRIARPFRALRHGVSEILVHDVFGDCNQVNALLLDLLKSLGL